MRIHNPPDRQNDTKYQLRSLYFQIGVDKFLLIALFLYIGRNVVSWEIIKQSGQRHTRLLCRVMEN